MVLSCFLGVFIANLFLELGFADLISKPITPLMKLANLPSTFSIPAMISTLDVRGGLSMIGSIREKNSIDDSAIIAYKLVSRPFSTVFFLFRYYLPVSLAALGFYVGSIYIVLSFALAFICMFFGIIYGKLKVKRREISFENPNKSKKKNNVIVSALNSAFEMTKKVFLRYIFVMLFVNLLAFFGIFDLISREIDIYTKFFGFSSNFAVIISIYIVSPLAAVLTAGEFLKNDLIGIKECLLSLLIGRFLFTALMDYPRHSLPFYASIFPIKLAFKLFLAGIVANAIAIAFLILVVFLF